MFRRLLGSTLVLLLAVGIAWSQATPPVHTAHGQIDKVGKDALTVRPRGPDGRFGKAIVLKVTGTTRITTVTLEKRAGKLVPVQKDTDVKDLQKNQNIAVIYAAGKGDNVLLSGVAQPGGK
jgi:hypothetical protein